MAIQINNGGDDDVIGQINTTPLVDVMLVLLIIFLITIPVVTNSVKLELPKEKLTLRQAKPNTRTISVTSAGNIFVGDTPVQNYPDLLAHILKFSQKDPSSTVEIHGDKNAAFEPIGRVLFALQNAGVTKVDLVLEP